MDDVIGSMSHEVFLTYMSAGIFTEGEIAEKISSYTAPTANERLELAQAVAKLTGGGPVTGPIRTALRALYDLPPVSGD